MVGVVRVGDRQHVGVGAVAPASSVQVTVMVCVPTSALTGVPEIVVRDRDGAGAPAMVYGGDVPSIHVSAHSGYAQAFLWLLRLTSAMVVATVGASFVVAAMRSHV